MNAYVRLLACSSLILALMSCDKQSETDSGGDPIVTILSPTFGSSLTGTVNVIVDGMDFSGGALESIVYYVDDVAIYTDPNPSASSPSSTWQWPTSEIEDGPRELKVVGWDSQGRGARDSIATEVANADEASAAVRSDGSGVIESPSGARIVVPNGAVPRYDDGAVATVVFSIEVDEEIELTPPPGTTIVSKIYRLGPGAFVFARPVEVTLPLLETANPTGHEVTLYRINPTTEVYENYGGSYDVEAGTVSGQTYQLSSWFLAMNVSFGSSPQDWGCIRVDNQSGKRMSLCVLDYALSYPQADQPLIPETGLSSNWAPSGEFDWMNGGHWWLPQGNYTICVQTETESGSGAYNHDLQQVSVNMPGGRVWGEQPECSATITDHVNPLTHEACGCIPEYSIPYGTGDVQVTLTWFNQQSLDLDLWVTDPEGERCYYANSHTASGGELDRDNLCGNYINGRPENIFWQTAPSGEYIVEVDWFSDCGHGLPTQEFNIRVINLGQVTNFDATVPPNGTVEVCRFDVVPHGIVFHPPQNDVIYHNPNSYSEVRNKTMLRN